MRDIEHHIQLEPNYRIQNRAPYRLSVPEAQELKRQLEELLGQGFIKPSTSPWSAPVVFDRKKDDTLRLCIDYRGLNHYTVKNNYPMRRADDLFDRLAGHHFFTKIDLRSGYHQILVAEEDQTKTAFRSRFGHYEFTVMPSGLRNAPATFQTAMNTTFQDLLEDSVLVYIDDILIYSHTLEEHLIHLCTVLQRLRDHGFYAKLSKCSFAKPKVDFLGHQVSEHGLHMDDSKIQGIVAGLAWSDIFLGEDGGDDGVVSADGEVLSVEVRALDCEGVNHDEEFLLVGGVIHLRGKEFLACEGDGVFARWSLGVSGRVLDGGGLGGVAGEMLGQYGSDGEVGGVSGDIEMASGVGDLEDRGCGDGLLDGDNMAEVFDARSDKRTFAELGVKFLLSEDREDLAEVLKVGLEGGVEDKDVIKVDGDTDFEEVAEDVVHGRLEGRGGIGESDWHHEELVVPEPRAEGGLVGVLFADTDLVEATAKVDLGKVLGSTEMIKELGNPRSSGGGLAGESCSVGAVGLLVPQSATTEATPFCLEVGALLGGVVNSSEEVMEVVFGGDVVEKAGAGGAGRGLVVGVEESIVVKDAREEVSKGHVGFVGEGGCKVFVAYSFDAGDERKVGNDGVGEVVAEGADVLDEAVRGTGLAEVAELFKGGGGGNGRVVEVEGLVDVVVEVVGVEEVGGGGVAGGGCGGGSGLRYGGRSGLRCGGRSGLRCGGRSGLRCGGRSGLRCEEGVICAVVTTVMEGWSLRIVVTRSHMDDILAFMSSREAVTEVRRVLSAWRMTERSGMAVFAGGCSPARLRAMLSTESVRMSDMLMEDAAMSWEEGVEDMA
ncbi:hypothetical protein CBR_g16158 [Chara braunii]|uniref:Reverse transcriptase domain-containing protein n=1 Tax=Chara braunii TaxID=69332 RepID=A0A388KTV8_CHABU|nr:hypothetical protein CBR_g16158 [Chara braunii]|eukprot:GBG73442.1 hypothetical protein CBR_g16158 [Chara braunii]